MSLDFLSPRRSEPFGERLPVARTPLAATLGRLGATFAERDGWSSATSFGDPEAEAAACRTSVGVADRSELDKLELTGSGEALAASAHAELGAEGWETAAPKPGTARRAAGAWWCPITPNRLMVIAEAGGTDALGSRLQRASVVDVTTQLGVIALVGPRARDVLARVTALDVRPGRLPEGGFRPGSIARTPGMLLRERGDSFLVFFGAAYAEYMWTVLLDGAGPLGGRAVGTEALDA